MPKRSPLSFREQAQGKQRNAWAEFGSFLLHNKKWWLAPIVLLLVALGALVLLGGAGLAPFIYTLF